MKNKRPDILFIHQVDASFVREDIRILKKIGNLKPFYFEAVRTNSLVLNLLLFIKRLTLQFWWLIKNIRNAQVIYCWFSDYHAFLPALFSQVFNIPLITVLGGFDCNKNEEFNYGIFSSGWRAPIGKFVISNNTILLPVDETLIKTKSIAKNWPGAHPNGLKNNIPNFNTDWRVLPTGYDPEKWRAGLSQREKSVVTVASCPNLTKALIKGLDLVIETAKLLESYSFTIVGIPDDLKKLLTDKYSPPENLKILPSVPRKELAAIYAESSVYLQPSRSEGMPNVLCEAMLCGCVPVGSPVFGIPNAIGDTGFIANEPDPKKISSLIKEAHNQAKELRPKARQRIIEQFSLERREQELIEIITEITK
ncbi:MAG: glycosyltransferase family 4 protein [Gracilimonas sp.]|uniref:glycosyltransferase family 4 protein n=1 Tax=Gracilimonas sp. TaxID=1974203 RepID=UPI0019874AE7|nr:glycosyltransferase family 4 protein [Gracilimonas sp.]MBD3616868.1 glycosyltransferase family 4 protein [Gracilimonas sp.]